jgi:hypothetical protein
VLLMTTAHRSSALSHICDMQRGRSRRSELVFDEGWGCAYGADDEF